MKYWVLLIGVLAGCVSCGTGRDVSNVLDTAAGLMGDRPEQALSMLESLDVDELSSASGRPVMRFFIRRPWIKTGWTCRVIP